MDIQDELLSAEAFGVPPLTPIERIQTHISWVFLLEKDVYKVKRPVDLGFLDFSSLEKRKLACGAEVDLNRRLAPQAYLGVVPICRTSAGRLLVGGPGEVIDWAVHMLRLRDQDRADTLLERGQLSPQVIDAIASRLAAFHNQAACDETISSWGSPEHVAQNIRENFVQTRTSIDRLLSASEADELERWQVDFVLDRAALLRQRVEQRRVRDGHGDLRLEHVYLEADNVTVLDCIEFNDRFRYADVCADIAFLSMDLGAHGRVDLAELLLARYARYANDFDLYGVVDFYESYRAFVRAKIACFSAQDATSDHATRERAWQQARRYALVSLAAKRTCFVPPLLMAIGGMIASGKSTLAERFGAELAAPIVDADRTRKHLAGHLATDAVSEPFLGGIYSDEMTATVYEELVRRASIVLGSGRPVIVDASFRTAAERAAVRELAHRCNVPFYFVECRATADVCRNRLVERAKGLSVSDGRLELFDAFAASFEAVTELEHAEHVVLDTTQELEVNSRELRRRMGFGPLPPE